MILFGMEKGTMFDKHGLIMMCHIGNILNENGTFMTFKRFTEKYDINTNYITYTGLMCTSCKKLYIRKTGLIVEENDLSELTKTIQVIYSKRNGATRHNSGFQ